MKILIICSKKFYSRIEDIRKQLEEQGNEVFMPNCYDEPDTELKMRNMGKKEHQEFKARMFKRSEEVISNMDAVLVLNFDKEKDGIVYKNYIGGATFLEMYDAFRMNKEIYLYNDIPEGMLFDEIEGFDPVVIHGDIKLVREAFGCTYGEFFKNVAPNIKEPTPMEFPELEPIIVKPKKLEKKKKGTK